MQQIIKTYRPFQWMIAAMTATILFCACGSGETKMEEQKTEPATETVAPPTDSMEPVDSSASTRPEVRKN
ncbi:hypothetical protein BH10BAC2_BH10BAC2_42300 [soil metagenome]